MEIDWTTHKENEYLRKRAEVNLLKAKIEALDKSVDVQNGVTEKYEIAGTFAPGTFFNGMEITLTTGASGYGTGGNREEMPACIFGHKEKIYMFKLYRNHLKSELDKAIIEQNNP